MAQETTEGTQWQQKTLETLLFSALKEQRAKRRWNIFFKLLFFVFLISFLGILWLYPTSRSSISKTKSHIGLIDVRGIISDSAPANADSVIDSLKQAFDDKNVQAVILRINSPGGSPVQASQIYQEIRYLRSQHPAIKLYTICGDLCASAAYYIAAASDNIYADPSSLVGSIGVRMDSFGFVNTLKKLGIERRLLTAGKYKGFLDPFSPQKANEKQIAEHMIQDVHQQFIDAVKQGRKNRLKPNADVFSGLAWSGQEALTLGLIDGLGDLNSVARDVIKNKNIVDYTVKRNLFEQFSDRLGASFAEKMSAQFSLMHIGFS